MGNSPSPAYNPISPSYQGGMTPGGGHTPHHPVKISDPNGPAYCPNTPAYNAASKKK